VNRISILLVLLMALVTACASNEASPSATAEPDPTVEATESAEPTSEASQPEGSAGTGFEGDLAELIPDELNGMARTDIPGMEAIIAQALAAQGMDASEAQFAFATYGEGEDAVVLNAFAIPGVDDASLDLLARSMAGVQGTGEVDTETVTIDGKSVLTITSGTQPGAVYLYFWNGVALTVASQSEDLAEQLLAELP
jgi:ABC-type amino acid transport substrate-binding protein